MDKYFNTKAHQDRVKLKNLAMRKPSVKTFEGTRNLVLFGPLISQGTIQVKRILKTFSLATKYLKFCHCKKNDAKNEFVILELEDAVTLPRIETLNKELKLTYGWRIRKMTTSS